MGRLRQPDLAARASIATWAARQEEAKTRASAAAEELARQATAQAAAQAARPKDYRRGTYRCGLCGVHGHNKKTCGRARVEAPVSGRPRRVRNVTLEAEIIDALGWGWHGVDALMHHVTASYGAIGNGSVAVAKRTIIFHLRRLEKEGRVLRDGVGRDTVYRNARRRGRPRHGDVEESSIISAS